ncbi:MAG: hypothetical protein V4574_14100 [Pseudomonadota bacterium]
MTMSIGEFCRDPSNSVTRERIFFHRLYFDLKLAAARRGYALTLFEPEVDRDAYDVMLDDGDLQRRVQLKSVLKTAKTASWKSSKRFLRLEQVYGDKLGLAPLDCGVGGGFVLIEIDDSDDEGRVRYFYSDYYIIQALAHGIIREKRSRRAYKSFGQPAKDRADFAREKIGEMMRGNAREPVELGRKLFLRARDTDSLLSLLGLHSCAPVHGAADKVMMAHGRGFGLDAGGNVASVVTGEAAGIAELAGEELMQLVDEPLLVGFKR